METHYEVIKPVELHKIYEIQDFIVTYENKVMKMTENIKLPYEIYYHNNLKNTRKCKFFRNHDGTKENRCVTFYENGNIESITHYHNDLLNGKFQTFYECGSLKDEGYYVNNKLHIYHITFFHPSIAPNRLYSYIEYTNGQIMGRHSIYMINGTLYKEQYIYQNLVFHDINNPKVYLNKYKYNDKEFVFRVVKDDNKIVAMSKYILITYNNNNQYYLFKKHLGIPYVEKLEDCKENIFFTFHYDRKNINYIVSVDEKKIHTFQKIDLF
jgi:hypothetical protein